MGPRAALHAPAGAATCSRRATSCCATTRREWDAVAASLGVARGSAAARQAGPRHRRRGRAARRRPRLAAPAGRHHRHRRSRPSRSACASRTARRCCCTIRSRNVAGAAHAGWRGTAAGAAAAAVRAMQQEFGSHAADLVAAIGPCLGACCGEVGPDVVEAFRAGGADASSIAAWFTPGTRRSIVPGSRARQPRSAAAARVCDPRRDLHVRTVHEDPPRAAALVSRRLATPPAACSPRFASPES